MSKNPICSILYVHFTLHISAVFISTWILPFLQDFDSTYQILVEICCTLWIWEISILSLKPTKVRPIYCCCAIFDKLWERLIVLSTKKTKQKLEEEKNACHTTYIVPKNQQDKIKLNELDKEQNSGIWQILLLMSALIFCITDQSEMRILEKPFKRLDVLKRPQKIETRERYLFKVWVVNFCLLTILYTAHVFH